MTRHKRQTPVLPVEFPTLLAAEYVSTKLASSAFGYEIFNFQGKFTAAINAIDKTVLIN